MRDKNPATTPSPPDSEDEFFDTFYEVAAIAEAQEAALGAGPSTHDVAKVMLPTGDYNGRPAVTLFLEGSRDGMYYVEVETADLKGTALVGHVHRRSEDETLVLGNARLVGVHDERVRFIDDRYSLEGLAHVWDMRAMLPWVRAPYVVEGDPREWYPSTGLPLSTIESPERTTGYFSAKTPNRLMTVFKYYSYADGGRRRGVVLAPGPDDFDDGLYASVHPDDLLTGVGPLLATGPTLGLDDDSVVFGPTSLVSIDDAGRAPVPEAGGGPPIGLVVSLYEIWETLAWLPYPYLAGGVVRDSRSGEVLTA